jgi:NAD(P)H-nitrite reductase large subunit
MSEFKSPLEQKPDYLVCICYGVMYSEIVQAINDGCEDFDCLQEQLMVGTGCSSCIEEIHEILQETASGK